MDPSDDLRVLVVDDSPPIAQILRLVLDGRLLAGRRFRIIHCGRLDEVAAVLEQHPVDVCVLDLVLPDSLDGEETYRGFRRLAPDCVVVVATGTDDPELACRLVRAGAEDYYVKGTLSIQAVGLRILLAVERHRCRNRPAPGS